MNRSEAIGQLAAALAQAQKVLRPATKDVTNTFYKSSYADLVAVTAACRDALADNDLSYSQMTDFDDERHWIETIIMHKSGEWISGRYILKPVKDDPQGMGSAATYARRYALMAAFGIVADDGSDDDGNAASGHDSGPAKKVTGPKPPAAAVVSDKDKSTAAKAWADKALVAINGFTKQDAFDAWVEANADKVASVRTYDTERHLALTDAIKTRYALLEPVNNG